jgi:hypothetical protein
MGADSEVPLTHRLERSHLLDAVRVEALEVQFVLEQLPRINRPAGTEKPRSWKAMNDTTYPLGGHGPVAGNPPFNGGGEQRKLSCFDKAEEMLTGNVGARPV